MSADQVSLFRKSGSWKPLEKIALELVAEARAGTKMAPLFGGGTRLMLAYEHRISNDIDLFIRDAQWIGYLTPRLNDEFGRFPTYDEASNYLKIKLPEGEIDFIVAMSLLDLPVGTSPETSFALEPVAEVLAKKLFYRGSSLTARDVFDWWAVGMATPEILPPAEIGRLLGPRLVGVRSSLADLSVSEKALATWGTLITKEKPPFAEALRWAVSRLPRERVILKPEPSGPEPF